MKKIATLLIALTAVFSSQACIKKNQNGSAAKAQSEAATKVVADTVVCFVEDSNNALIGHAIVRIGADSVLTDWSGRVMLPAGAKVKIEAIGYKSKNVTISGKTNIVVLEADKTHRNPYGMYGSHRGDVMYRSYDGAGAPGAMKSVSVYSLGSSADMAVRNTETAEAVELHDHKAVVTEAEFVMDEVLGELPMEPMSGMNISAGKLTAGEVNDFAQWGLWPSILDSTHRQYVGDWKMQARERYTVQLVSRDHHPIAGRQVSLMSQQGTVFQAITDNSGRAELWNGLTGKAAQGRLWIRVSTEHGEQKANLQAGQICTIELDEACETTEVTDVMFVMDATGSMGDELRYMTAELKDVIDRSEHAVEGVTIRTGAVVYRDHGDEYLTRISRLTEDVSKTQAFLDKQEANGGGDYEEAIPEALMATIQAAGWSENSRARIAFVIFDAPCHKDSSTLALLHEQVLNAAAMGVRLVPVVCSGLRESGELLARTMALATNGTSFFLTDDSGIGETHLKPTTDTLKVEHLNDMLVRTIVEFSQMPACEFQAEEALADEQNGEFLPNPTNAPSVHGAAKQIHIMPNPCTIEMTISLEADAEQICLVDATGKCIIAMGAQQAGNHTIAVDGLATGVYFVKALINGGWHTEKAIIY